MFSTIKSRTFTKDISEEERKKTKKKKNKNSKREK